MIRINVFLHLNFSLFCFAISMKSMKFKINSLGGD